MVSGDAKTHQQARIVDDESSSAGLARPRPPDPVLALLRRLPADAPRQVHPLLTPTHHPQHPTPPHIRVGMINIMQKMFAKVEAQNTK